MRRYILFFFALMSLAGSLVAVFASIQQRDIMLRGYVDPTRDHSLPFWQPRLGVNAELTQYTPDLLAEQLNLMQQAHITWVRQFFRWDEIAPQPGIYDWRQWDQVVSAFENQPEMGLVAVLVNTPSWARETGNENATAPPESIEDFAQFTRLFATRYGNVIDHYQIWDEPNLTAAWGNKPPRPSQYVALLQVAYEAIHNADPSATVIAAALAPTTERGPQNISDVLYLRDLYALGAKAYMDAVGAKPYGFDAPPDDRTVNEEILNFSRLILLREQMLMHDDGQKAIWASHWGWNSLPEDWIGKPSIWGSVKAEQQVQYTLNALARAEREWPWLAGMILQHWQPAAAPDDPQWGFTLVQADGTPTSVWTALSQRLPSTHASNGLYFAANSYAHYSGVWTFGSLGADIGWINDSQLEFDFTGRDIALLLRKDNYVAYLYPTIDGQPANAVPQDSDGNGYIILTSQTLLPELRLIPVAYDLPDANHTLHVITDELVPDEVADRWALAGYAVSSGNLAVSYERQILLALLTTAAAVIAVVSTAWQIDWLRLITPLRLIWHGLGDTGQLILSAVTSIALMMGLLLTWGDAVPTLFRREPVVLGLAVVSAGLAYIQPGFALTLVAFLFLFILMYHRLDLGLALVIFWSPFFLFPVELYLFALPMPEILVFILTAAWGLRGLAHLGHIRQSQVSQYPPQFAMLSNISLLDLSLLAWLVLSAISLSWVELHAPALRDFRVMTMEPLLFYMVLRTVPLGRKAILRLVDTLLIAGLFVAMIGLWLFFQGTVITAEGGAARLVSVYGSPNNVGLFLGRCIPFALAFAVLPVDSLRRRLAFIVLLVLGLAVIFSQSAGALLIGIPAATVAVLLLAWGRRAWPVMFGIGIGGIGMLLLALRSARFARLLDFSTGTNFARIRVWQSALNVIRDYPLTGLGPDQFLYAFRGHYILPDAWQEPDLSHPHNFVLDLWVRIGVLGVLIFSWIQFAFWRLMMRAYKFYRSRDTLYFAITLGVMGSMINVLGHGLVDNSVYVQDLAYVFMLLLGLAAQLSNTRAIDEEN